MARRDATEGPYRRIAIRHWSLIAAGVASFGLGVLVAGQLPHSERLRIFAVLTGMLFFGGFVISAMVITRCPYCRWMLYLTQTKWGPWSHPWPDRICSNCKRDLAKPDPSVRHTA